MPSYLPNPQHEDKVKWLPDPQGHYLCHSSWKLFYTLGNKVPWHKLVWFPKSIPRISFVLWMAMHGKFGMKDQVKNYMQHINTSCVFCRLIGERALTICFLIALSLVRYGVECLVIIWLPDSTLHGYQLSIQLLIRGNENLLEPLCSS